MGRVMANRCATMTKTERQIKRTLPSIAFMELKRVRHARCIRQTDPSGSRLHQMHLFRAAKRIASERMVWQRVWKMCQHQRVIRLAADEPEDDVFCRLDGPIQQLPVQSQRNSLECMSRTQRKAAAVQSGIKTLPNRKYYKWRKLQRVAHVWIPNNNFCGFRHH